MNNKPKTEWKSVRIPKEARAIIMKEKSRLDVEENKAVFFGDLALLYIKRGKLFKDLLEALQEKCHHCSVDPAEDQEICEGCFTNKTLLKARDI